MLRSALGVVAGVLVGFLVVFVVELLGQLIYPPPEGLDPSDPESIRAYMAEIPLGAKLFVVGAWCLGAPAAVAVALLISKGGRISAGIAFAIFLAAVVANLAMIPHPVWMAIAGVVGPAAAALVAAFVLGGRPKVEA